MKELGWLAGEEVVLAETGYSVDMMLTFADRPELKVVLEVDGPSHFCRDRSVHYFVPKGNTILKRRLLAASGWKVIVVPFYEWGGLKSASERQVYLQDLVNADLAGASAR